MGAVMTGFDKSQASAICARGDASGFGHLGDAVGDFPVGFFGLGEQPTKRLVGLGADAGIVPVAAELAARLRAPGDNADPFSCAQRQHLPLLFAVEQVDEVLHADEAGPAVSLGHAEGAGELPSVHGRGADIARFAGFDDVV